MARPSVDVVVPFRGTPTQLEALLEPVEQLSYEFGRSLPNGVRAP